MAAERPNSVFELRPMRLGDLLDVVIRLYRQHFGQFVRIAAVVYVPLGVVQVAAAALLFGNFNPESSEPFSFTPSTIAGAALFALYLIAFWLSWPLVQGAVAKAVAEVYLGRQATVASTYGFVLRRWPILIWVGLLTGLIGFGIVMLALGPSAAVMAGMGVFSGEAATGTMVAVIGLSVLLFLAAVAVSMGVGVRLFFSGLTVVLEDEEPIGALRRSWQLTEGRFWHLLFAVFILTLFAWIGTVLITLPAQLLAGLLGVVSMSAAQALNGASGALAQILVEPLQIIGVVLLYYDLRMRREGFDLAMMAEAIGEPELAVRPTTGEAAPALFGPGARPLDAPEETDEPADTDQLPEA